MSLIPPLTHASSSTRYTLYNASMFILFFAFLVVSPHLWRIRGNNTNLRYAICIPSLKFPRWKPYVFFLFFFLFLSNHVLAKKIDDRIPRTMDDPRNINLSTNLLFSKRSIYTSLRVYRRLRSKYFRTIFQILGNSFPNIYTSILFFATRFNTGVGTVRCTFVLG